MSRSGAVLVGLDVGTTRIKAGLVDPAGVTVGTASVRTPWTRVRTGAELRPAALLGAVVRALDLVLAAVPGAAVIGLGVTSMAETVVLLDRTGRPVGPAVAWHDTRARGEFAEYNDVFGADVIGRRTGLGTDQLPTAPTLRWLTRHVPETRDATCALGVAEWVVHALGGDRGAEASLASRTGVLSVADRTWWTEVLDWAGLPASLFPEVRTAGSSWGRCGPGPAVPGRLRGAPLTVAGHDDPCAAVGVGVVRPAQVMDSCGTAEAFVRAVPAPGGDLAAGLATGVSRGWHVLAGHHALMASGPLGLELSAVLGRLGIDGDEARVALDLAAASDPTGDGPAAQWRDALLARVAAATGMLRALEELAGPVDEVRITGGWATNPVLVAGRAGAFPRPVYPPVGEAGIRGAALLAGCTAGVHPDAAHLPPPLPEKVSPVP